MDARTASSDDRLVAAPSATLAGLSAAAAARALVASCDLAMVVDREGVVRDIAVGSEELSGLALDSWLNRPWADTVVPENRGKISEMLAGGGGLGRWRQVNHATGGIDLPLRYLAFPDGGDGSLVVVGRDLRAAAALQQRLLRAQQAMERDSLRLRQLEARYRLLFDTAPEAIIVVDASTRQMTEINPAARRLAGLGNSPGGEPFAMIIHASDRDDVIAYLGAVAAAEQKQPMRVRMADGEARWISATLFRQDRSASLLVRLQQVGLAEPPGSRALGEVLERMPDAFVLTDARHQILASNGAFLDLVGQVRNDDVRGQPLWNFVGRPGIDIGILGTQLAEHGQLRNFATIVRGPAGEEAIELSAVTSGEAGETHHGFSIRLVGRRLAEAGAAERQVPRSVEQLTELVGRVSLKEIVRESTDLIERLCIEAALNYTSDNRASAAEILGLSRQSLYSKLHRHGLGNLSDHDG